MRGPTRWGDIAKRTTRIRTRTDVLGMARWVAQNAGVDLPSQLVSGPVWVQRVTRARTRARDAEVRSGVPGQCGPGRAGDRESRSCRSPGTWGSTTGRCLGTAPPVGAVHLTHDMRSWVRLRSSEHGAGVGKLSLLAVVIYV